jgi:hypothetical protein
MVIGTPEDADDATAAAPEFTLPAPDSYNEILVGEEQLILGWNNVSGADGYQYMCIPAGEAIAEGSLTEDVWSDLGTDIANNYADIDNTKYYDVDGVTVISEPLQAGTEYVVYIRAYVDYEDEDGVAQKHYGAVLVTESLNPEVVV